MTSTSDLFKRSRIFELLRDNGVIHEDSIVLYSSRVRDRDDIKAYRCTRSGVIFLDRTDHVSIDHYIEKDLSTWSFAVGESRVPFVELDNARHQAARVGSLIEGRRWLDFGCGAGSLLQLLGPRAATAVGVEPTLWYADSARSNGLNVVSSLNELRGQTFDVITLFHVFEHLAEPIEMAIRLRELLSPGGTIIVEVPHARDVLLEMFDSIQFRNFTLWSEHLVLHTRDSLRTMLARAGFVTVETDGVQRFPISNHLYWLRHGQPGGHSKWEHIDSDELSRAYEATLKRLDATDTIVAIASN